MIDFIRKNFVYVLFSLVIFLIFVSFFFFSFTKRLVNPVSTRPSSAPVNAGPQPGRVYSEVTKENIAENTQSQLVSQLTGTLPYQGKDFYLEYFYTNYVYQLTFYKSREDQGEKEFEQYLKDSQIEDKSWLKRLVIKII